MNIKTISDNIILKDGVWYSKNDKIIFYPEKGHLELYNIEDNSYWFKHRNSIIYLGIEKYIQNKTIFDIGGGNGFVAQFLQEKGYRVVLLEPGKIGVLNAKQRGIKNIICSTLEEVNFHKDSINNIGIFDVLEHIDDDFNLLKNINYILKPNGLIFITVPAFNILWNHTDQYAQHFRRYEIKTLQTLLKNAGFDILYSTYFFSFLFLPIFLIGSIPFKLGFRNKKQNNSLNKNYKNNIFSKIAKPLFDLEIKLITKNKKINFGTSCYVIAKKSVDN